MFGEDLATYATKGLTLGRQRPASLAVCAQPFTKRIRKIVQKLFWKFGSPKNTSKPTSGQNKMRESG